MAHVTSSKNQVETAFKQMTKRFKVREDNISVVDSRIAKEQADELRDLMEFYYLEVIPRMDPKGLQDHDVTFEVVQEDTNRYRVVATGEKVLYDEFGTGEKGVQYPHPQKSRYNLNDYNSGEYVSTHIDKYGNHYWFWNDNINYGQIAGMFVYHSVRDMQKGLAREIAVREINKENKKFLNL